MRNAAALGRIHRVRTVQLAMARADEVRAGDRLISESQLRQRVAQLVDQVAPAVSAAGGLTLLAAAHYRERLQETATAVGERVRMAELATARAAQATQAARRDQSAVEKLIERADAEAMRRELRAMEDLPPARRNRHGSC